MKIKKMQVNGFGNLENKSLELDDNINILYGKNETGKSTLAGFIKGVFYGVNRNKAGNEYSEFERYKPWRDIDFSGKLEFENNGKTYTVFRDFNRNNCKVYDSDGNDITSEFNKDKSRGAEVGSSYFGIDEETFENTLLIMQGGTSIELQSQKNIIQKLTNMIQSGQEGVSFEKIKAKLQKKYLDEIGTDRTRNKPINLVNKDINDKEQSKQKLLRNRERKVELENSLKKFEDQIKNTDDDIAQINKVLEIREKYTSLLEDKERTYELTLKIREKEKEEKEAKSKAKLKLYIGLILFATIIASAALIYFNHYVWCLAELVLAISGIVVLKRTNTINLNTNELPDLAVIKEELNKKEKKELEKLVQKGIKQSFAERRAPELKNLLSGYEKKKNDLILEIHKINIEENSLKENIDKLVDLEEQLADLTEKKEELMVKSKVINIAIQKLDEAYEELKLEVIPEMEKSIKSMVGKTTDGKYNDVIYNNDEGMLVENSIGELVPISKLSMGTIDQMYLGFRMGISKKFGDLPIILDESFAYYDDERLENTLKTLLKLNKQIIIMTCSDREKNILDKLKEKYNYLEV